jgi:antitoxin (DNA-binding transcriptional repressor) of toxin-antitoxin stability system
MVTKMVDIRNIKPELKEMITLVEEGTEIIFLDDDTPVARLVSLRQRVAGLHPGAIIVSPSFEEPLPDEFWTGNA